MIYQLVTYDDGYLKIWLCQQSSFTVQYALQYYNWELWKSLLYQNLNVVKHQNQPPNYVVSEYSMIYNTSHKEAQLA